MQPLFIRAEFDLGMDFFDPPETFLTPDARLLKIIWYGQRTTYHLPETHSCVTFTTLEAAFHAAYGKPMRD
jgi:hypothetical protein